MHHEAFSRPEPLLPSPGHPPILLSVGEEGQLHRTGTRIVLSLYHYIKIKSLDKLTGRIVKQKIAWMPRKKKACD